MAIKRLYVNGDSWTYGQELGDELPDELDHKFYNTWPWFLSQRMNIPQLINDALGGGSCDRIFRKTVDFIKSKDTLKDTIVILGWTSAERFEWPTKYKRIFHNGTEQDFWEEITYVSMMFSQDVAQSDPDYREYMDTIARLNGLKNKWFRIREYEADLKKVEQYVYILDELVKAKGGKIYHFWALGDTIPQYNLFDDNVMAITTNNKWPMCKHRHPTEETHQKIADIIYDAIQNKEK